MVKRIIRVCSIVVMGILTIALPAYAVDISDAEYKADLVAVNSGSAATGVATVCSINSQALIDGNYVTSDFKNTAVQTASGTDILYMPGVGANPWCAYIGDIGAGESKPYLFYCGGAAKQAGFPYFPGSGGMTCNDNATLESGSNYSNTWTGFLDTTAGAGKYLYQKASAVETAISSITSGKIYTKIYGPANSVTYSSASDGYIYVASGSYSTGQSAATGTASSASTTGLIGQVWDGATYYIYRSFFYFDTSYIPDNAIITSAILSVYGQSDTSTTDFNITVQSGQPTYPHDPLVAGDYDKTHYSGSGGTLSTASFSTSDYNGITLNSTGIGWISLTGTTNLCLRSDREIAATTPGGSEYVAVYNSDEAGTSKDPKLTINYYVENTATGIASGSHTVTASYLANYITNSSAENGDPPTGWSAWAAGTMSRSNTQAKYGTYSAKLVTSSGALSLLGQIISATAFQGKTLTFGCWLWIPAGSTTNMTLWDDVKGYDGITTVTGNSAWQWKTVTGTVAGAATSIHATAIETSAVGSITGYADGAILSVASSLPNQYYNFNTAVDGVIYGTAVDGGVSVVDNANNISVASGGSFLYLDNYTMHVNGTLVQDISYSYAATFTDASGHGTNMTPSFRTTSSSGTVSATLQNFRPVVEADCAAPLTEATPEMLTTVPTVPPEFFGTTGWGVDHLPFAAAINDLLDEASIPHDFFWIIAVFGLAAILAHLGFWMLKSIFFQSVIGGVVILFFSLATGGYPICLWLLIPYIVIVFGVNTSERTYGL